MTHEELVIVWRNQIQNILWQCELCGQVSDGYWENSRPHNHWRQPCNAESIVDDGTKTLGPSFWPARRYNFSAHNLLKVVGNRMLSVVKTYLAFPHLSFDHHWDYEMMEGVEEYVNEVVGWTTSPDNYWRTKATRIFESFGVPVGDADALRTKLAAIDKIQFTMSDMKRQLEDMKSIYNK